MTALAVQIRHSEERSEETRKHPLFPASEYIDMSS